MRQTTPPVIPLLKLTFYAACLGVGIGFLSTAYYFALQLGLRVVGLVIPSASNPTTLNAGRYVWIVTTIGGFLVGLAVQ